MTERTESHKEKVAKTQALKEALFHNLDYTLARRFGMLQPKDTKEKIWQIVKDELKGAYSKGYLAGRKTGFAEGLITNVTKLAKDLTFSVGSPPDLAGG